MITAKNTKNARQGMGVANNATTGNMANAPTIRKTSGRLVRTPIDQYTMETATIPFKQKLPYFTYKGVLGWLCY